MPGDAARRHDSALASPPSSPPKQPPPPSRPSTLVPSATPCCPSRLLLLPRRHRRHHRDGVPLVSPLPRFNPPRHRDPLPPLAVEPSCLGPTNAILIGRKGGIQECKDLPRAPQGERPSSPCLCFFSVFSTFSARSTEASSYGIVFSRNALWLIFFLPRGRSFYGKKTIGWDAGMTRKLHVERCVRMKLEIL